MKFTKKQLFGFILIFAIFAGFMPAAQVSADTEATLTVSSVSDAEPGDAADIQLTLESNPGIAGLKLRIEYDETRLNTSAVTNGTALSGLSYIGSEQSGALTALWYGASNAGGTGLLLNIRFTVRNGAAAGEAYVNVICETRDSVNSSGSAVPLSVTNGSITVKGSAQNPSGPTEQPDPAEEPGDSEPKTETGTEIVYVNPSLIPQIIKETAGTQNVFTIYSAGQETETKAGTPHENSGGAVPESLVVYHINDETGALTPVAKSVYDARRNIMEFAGVVGEMYTIAPNSVKFDDVTQTDWFFGAVSFAASRGLFLGEGNNLFAPRGTMTRGMFLTVLARLDGVDLSSYTTSPYTDTEIGAWYGPAVAWAADFGVIDAGILEDCTPGTFMPGEPVTREQMAVIFANYIKSAKLALQSETLPVFADIEQASPWARGAVGEMRNLAVINGIGENLYNPRGTASRAEVAQIFTNLVNAVLR